MIPVSSLSDTIVPLTLVIKRKSFWCWKKPKYRPTDFTVNDVLTGDTPIQPVVNETNFLKYSGTFGGSIEGNVGASSTLVNTNLQGKDNSKLQSSGTLKKEEIDVQKLLQDSKDRVLDMAHPLIQQTREKHKEVFGIVKERIITTQPFSVVEDVQQGGQLGGQLSICLPNTVKVSLKPNASLHKDSNIKLEIPANTVIAYSLIELQVKATGLYELCLMSDTLGGFEVDGPVETFVGLSSSPKAASYKSCLQQEFNRQSPHFKLLSALPPSTRSTLLQLLMTTMEDRQAVALLEDVLEEVCYGKSPVLDDVQDEVLRMNIQAVVNLLYQTDASTQRSIHLIVGALDEMVDEGFYLLRSCCSPVVLQALHILVERVTEDGDPSPNNACLDCLNGEVYDSTERLFSVSNVMLKKEGNTVITEVCHHSDNRTLVLCIAVKGLASLVHSGNWLT